MSAIDTLAGFLAVGTLLFLIWLKVKKRYPKADGWIKDLRNKKSITNIRDVVTTKYDERIL